MAKINKAMWYIGVAGIFVASFAMGFIHDAVVNAED